MKLSIIIPTVVVAASQFLLPASAGMARVNRGNHLQIRAEKEEASSGNSTLDNFIADISDDDPDARLIADAFEQILKIPQDILEKSDDEFHNWLKEHPFIYKTLDDLKDGVEDNIDEIKEAVKESSDDENDNEKRANMWACAAAILNAFATFVPPARILKYRETVEAMGGVWKIAKLLVKSETWEDFGKQGGDLAIQIAKDLSGAGFVAGSCFP